MFIEHGGMWGDTFIVSPLVAYMVSEMKHPSPWGSLVAISITVVVGVMMIRIWAQATAGNDGFDEAFARNGKLTISGWLHFVYMLPTLSVVIMYYWCQPRGTVSVFQAGVVSILMAVHTATGILQPDWHTNGKISSITWRIAFVMWALIAISFWWIVG